MMHQRALRARADCTAPRRHGTGLITPVPYWARNLADGGIRWHELSQPVTQEFRCRARSVHDCQGYEEAPPAGFEPAHTAPEGNPIQVPDLH
jgi:hypothetical protein